MTKLSEILKSKVGVDVDFIDLLTDEAVDGSPIVKLVLAKPIPVVYGRTITDRVTDEQTTLEAADVEMISIGSEALAEIDALEDSGVKVFNWDVEGKSGNLKCNLKMDVSQRQEVWIVKTSLAQYGRNKRNERQNKQKSQLMAKISESKTRRVLGNTDVNAPVEPETVGAEKN